MRMIVLAVLLLAAAGAGLWLMIGGDRGRPSAPPDLADPALVRLGGELYTARCAACHGADLEGEPDWRVRKPDGTLPAPPHDETGHTWHHPDAFLFAYTKRGGEAVAPPDFKSGMPAFAGTLSDREIWAVLAYIKSRWPAEIRARQEALSERMRERR